MSFLEDISKSWVSSALVGLGAVLVAPVIFPGLREGLRPLAKSLVKGGIVAYDSAKELVSEVGEQMNDMVAEVRAEMEESSSATERSGRTETKVPPRSHEGQTKTQAGAGAKGRD